MKTLNKQINKEALTDKAANSIAKGILKTQSGFEKYMRSLSKKWKNKQQWIFLYLVCLVFGGLSIVAIINPFRAKDTNSSLIPKPIAVPKSIHQQRNGFAITESEFQKVQEYKAKHPNLQKERPGLFDSLSMIEEVYYSQKKNNTMENKHSVKFLRQRKMMVVLPLLVLPFITMAFWALGGGKGTGNDTDKNKVVGLNLQLPNANLKSDKNEDKLSFYMEADADSLKRAELLRSDPFYKDSLQTKVSLMDATQHLNNPSTTGNRLNTSVYQSGTDANEQKIYEKIDEINKQINQPETTASSLNNAGAPYQNNEQFTNDVDRMQQMMQMMDDKQETDPEMQQLNGTLDKILDIQHPQRVKDKLKEKSLRQKEVVFAVSKMPAQDNISLLDTIKHTSTLTVGFYGTSETFNNSNDEPAVEAVVHANQTLVNGAIIKLRLSTDIYINGTLIPKGNFVYGSASLNDERLEIEINSIRYNTSLFPVKLEVYDVDGLPGIHIPGAITRDVAKQSVDNSLQFMELSSVDPSFKAQAAAAGISAAKGLLGRKVKQVKVLVKEGYKILLRNRSNQ